MQSSREGSETVDFNAEATVSAAATDILRVLILQRRNDVIDAIEGYRKIELHSEPDSSIVRARLFSLFLEIQAMLKRKRKDYDELRRRTESQDIYEMIELYFVFNEFLDENRLIRIDTKEIYDRTRVSVEDKVKGI